MSSTSADLTREKGGSESAPRQFPPGRSAEAPPTTRDISPAMTAVGKPSDIYTEARECRDLFEQYVDDTPRTFHAAMSQAQYRFLTWASFLGVFAEPAASLDARLRKAPDMKSLVLSMLAVLKRNIARGLKRHAMSSAESPIDEPEPDGAVRGVVGAIDRLHAMATMIRNPPRTDEVERVQQFAAKRDADGFEDVIYGIIDFLYGDLETDIGATPRATESLRSQLAKSIIFRRNRLLYQPRHERKLRRERKATTPEPVVELPTKSSDLDAAQPDSAVQPPVRPSAETILSPTDPSRREYNPDFVKHLETVPEMPRRGTPSVRSRSSNPLTSAFYPRAPAPAQGDVEAECLFCPRRLALSLLADGKQWKTHVDADLRPYVCISERCGNFPPSFATRKDWRAHMQEKHGPNWFRFVHRPEKWLCTFGHSPPRPFASEELLRDHLAKDHEGRFHGPELDLIASKSKRAQPSTRGVCPICAGDQTTNPSPDEAAKKAKIKRGKRVMFDAPSEPTSDTEDLEGMGDTSVAPDNFVAKLLTHIADHLQYAAFFSLRWWSDDSGREAEEETSESRQGIGSQSGRDDQSAGSPFLDEDALRELRELEILESVREAQERQEPAKSDTGSLVATTDDYVPTESQENCRVLDPLALQEIHDDIAAQRSRYMIEISAQMDDAGFVQPKPKKSDFFKKMLESAKIGVASTRGSIATAGAGSVQSSPVGRPMSSGISSFGASKGPPVAPRDAAREMGLGNGVDWVQVRRDVNRSNTLSRIERSERRDRCQMLDFPTLDPVDELYDSMNGDEGGNGMPVQDPINYQAINLSQVDMNSRFISSLPPMTTAITLATTYVCRPYCSDVQRLRAIFTWVAEKINWEEDFEGEIDTRRVIQTKRGCAEEFAVLTMEMCNAVGMQCEVIQGYLKTPGEIPESGIMPQANLWWNAVIIDNEWRIMDCCLASPSNPRRALYSSVGPSSADFWWFLARPSETCYSHMPKHHSQQHICPPVTYEVLLNLPYACPPYFKNRLQMFDYNTSLTRIEDLEMVHIKFNVPEDVEVAAEVEVQAYTRDSDGDFFESGDVFKKRALAQAEWFSGVKRYTVKALLPGDEGTGILKVYAGKRGLMHSIKDIPHPLAFALPIIHSGENPPYEFVTRHPTPHAQRHDIYVVQPQCASLALNHTFVFAIRQHPSSTGALSSASTADGRAPSPLSSTTAGSSAYVAGKKPAKLAIQTPGGKILRLMRKEDKKGIGVGGRAAAEEEASDGGTWETIIKCSERGVWRGLVLADRTARWCVFAEWMCGG